MLELSKFMVRADQKEKGGHSMSARDKEVLNIHAFPALSGYILGTVDSKPYGRDNKSVSK